MELFKSTSRRGFSVRGMLAFALTVIMTALLWATFAPGTTHAADPLVAVWKGDTILYDGHQYSPEAPAEAVNSLGFPQGAHYYVYTAEPVQNIPTQKAFVIYFAPGTDPPTEKTATLATYTYSTSSKLFSNPVDKKTIDITVKGKESTYSSCTVEGIGWIICPVSVFLADSMDNIFKLISGFFEVQPVTVGNSNNSLYIAWNVMRSIANLAFIIVFLIIIYSQLVNAGISNYGLKKLLPRLIVAAILVNLSYLICSIAVDVSNILGYSIQDIFVQIRKDTFNITNDSWSSTATTWTGVTTAVLSGGALIGAKVALGGGTFAGALPILLPILVGVTLTCLFVLLILAARQAIIVILIVIAPLAFVAYLLPNTEKWFGKWRELFVTMLVFFPAFSLVFGGSQLAGGLIIMNPNNSPIAVIFGLAVQVAPLVITPLLLKLSGGLLGKIAGLVNNPRNGIMDRSKKWSSDRIERNRLNSLRKPGGLNPFRRLSQTLDNSGQKVKKRTALYSAMNENRFNDTDANEKLHTSEASVNLEKERIENKLKAHTQRAINTRGSYLNIQSIQVEDGKVTMERLTDTTSAMNAEYRAGDYNTGGNARLGALQKSMAANVIATSVQKQRQQSAQNEQLNKFADALEKNVGLQIEAGGIDPKGAQRALAAAITAQSKAHSEAVSNANSILSHYNYGDDVVGKLALGIKDTKVKINMSDDIIEAAIIKIAGGPNTYEIQKLMENIEINDSDANAGFRQAFADTLGANANKPKFAGAGALAKAKQGEVPGSGKKRIDSFVAETINGNKFASAEVLVTQDATYLETVYQTLRNNESSITISDVSKAKLLISIQQAQDNPQYSGRIGESEDVLGRIKKLL